MNAEEKEKKKLTLEIDLNEKLPEESHTRYNMGYAVIMKMYHELELDRFFNNKARHETFEYNTNSIMKLLTIVTTVFMPLTLITGWYGMNFINMPELQWEYGYPAIIIVSILVIIGCMSVFRRKHYW